MHARQLSNRQMERRISSGYSHHSTSLNCRHKQTTLEPPDKPREYPKNGVERGQMVSKREEGLLHPLRFRSRYLEHWNELTDDIFIATVMRGMKVGWFRVHCGDTDFHFCGPLAESGGFKFRSEADAISRFSRVS
jgi:hypothetical protein